MLLPPMKYCHLQMQSIKMPKTMLVSFCHMKAIFYNAFKIRFYAQP